ncbi:carbohydrate ABC transporter substrate-binding protein (CUT1 family) [Roseinatronobacter thiooxidans]|uniref:Carbohydrate ABC transporter substrate-binding protein (CUT1 family) n=1 Tax=Roseinatronobacter thiooxidans TaxID=121821 RepID=A0A2W7QS55_9RHOB|nr:sugar ABC transporter substrate-binding protein [Roseinatronobacter thiooxidans]PZX41235.1 carbohydrate ABC transporter substrate-binding protein (CUT1 family) [Roseinatronobacter thiooxidans]
MLNTLRNTTIIATLTLGSAVLAQDGPYAPYAGTTLVVNFPSHPHYNAAMEVLPQFTAQTGIEVEVDMLPYLDMRERQTLELTLSEGAYDLISYVVFSKADYVYADQLENLAKYFMNPRLADPTYDAGDLIDGYVQNIGVAGGEKGYLPGPTGSLFGLPFGSETSVLFYRKDVFEKHGLTAPETYDELLDLACRIPELEPGMGGVASRAASGHQASHALLLHLAPLGGRVFDDAWQPRLNDAQGVAAAEALKRIVDCGPEGSSAFGPNEAANAFAQGQAAMFIDSIAFAPTFEDESRSTVAGNVGYAMHPMGVQRASQTGGFGLGIPANAQHKEAAFLLMQWLTSKEGDLAVALAGGNPSRFSTYENEELNALYPWSSTFGEALQYADPDWRPIIPAWGRINADIGTTMSQVLTQNLDIQEALDGIAERTRALMEEQGYYIWQ